MPSSRRNFLLAGGALVATACGSSSKSGPVAPSVGLPQGFAVAQRFPNTPLLVPGPVRLPVSLAVNGELVTTGPARIKGAVLDNNDDVVANVEATIRSTDIVIPYWAFEVDIPTAGFHTLRLEGDDGTGAAFIVFDPDDVTVPALGDTLDPFATPTVDDHRGVEPYCSLTPSPCPLHDVTLTEALTGDKPVAFLVGTPAHCQTGTCAPGLEFLVTAHQRLGSAVTMVHADVYADDAGTTLAPVINAMRLDYEPVVYLCSPGGTIVWRLDGVWDQSELDAALARIS